MVDEKSNLTSKYFNDVATGKDSLGFKPYVEAIAEFLTDEDTLAPITLSIEGQWGCGKSSFMKQLSDKIEEGNGPESTRKKYFTVWFNCWRYEKEDELWAAFALNFMDELSKQLSWKPLQHSRLELFYLRYKLKLKSNFLIFVHFYWSILSFVLVFLFLSLIITYVLHYLGMPLPFFIENKVIENFANVVLILTPLVGLMNYFSTEKWFIDLFRDPFGLKKLESNTNYKERIPFREHFHSDFNQIIKSYVGDSKVYVFIDDLDRCEVPKAAELMQALNLMISDKSNVYFSIGMDRKVISAGLAARNENILPYLGVDGLKYGYDFIEKFIQLPFKVPSPTNEDFKKLLNPQHEQESSSKASDLSVNSSSNLKAPHSSSQSDKENDQSEPIRSIKSEETIPDGPPEEETEVPEPLENDSDCEDPKELDNILEMIVPALDRNPRRMKQFINLFRFQRTIGKRTGLFSYDTNTDNEYMWNCKKLAKFVAISMKWPSLISDLGSDLTLLDQLQDYALKSLKPENENEKLEKWTKDERLTNLLRYGCVEEGNPSENKAEYIFSGLDFSKLLQISPVVVNPDTGLSPINVGGIEFMPIPAGNFMMGSPKDEEAVYYSEGSVHNVTIKNPFYLGKYPVTQKQWENVMGSNPSILEGDDRPVENISWNDVQDFIKKLNGMEGTHKYRLPSEAEWEYACRAGTTTRYSFGDDESKLEDYAWYSGYETLEEWNEDKDYIKNKGTHPVGQKKPNPWNLYDMHGNVWEWVQDKYHDNYEGAPSDGSVWEDGNSSDRVFRGGDWDSNARGCRSAARSRDDPRERNFNVGFRLLRKL